MPAKVDQGTIIVLDVGRNVCIREEKNDYSFFDKAMECVAKIIERKIISQAKCLVGIILLGSKKTKNVMAENCPGSFRHIEVLQELQTPTWQMIKDLPKQGSNSTGDWIDSLVVAADQFINGVSDYKIGGCQIIMITNFQTPTKQDPTDVEQVLNGFKEENIEVDVFGLNIDSDDIKVTEDIEKARMFVENTEGQSATFEETMGFLQFHRKKKTNPNPWNVDLSIGPNVKIPVSAYIRLEDKPVVKNWKTAIKDPVTSTASTTEGVMKTKLHINPENQTVVEPNNVIKGYNYGQQIIPFTECDKSMLYESGDKCLSVYGFTQKTNVTWQNLSGDSLYYIFGKKGDKKAQDAVTCLVKCLYEMNLVGIVRRVYNKGNAPKMFVLMPVIDTNNYICLSMTAICFKEEIKHMMFPSTNLKKYECTADQVNAFKDLIAAMDLTQAYDETYDESEAFPVAETVSPSAQYVLDCIAYRALNPGKPLPQPRDDIMMLFKKPPLIDKRSQEPLKKLKSLFTLKKVEVKSRRGKKLPQFDDIPLKQDQPSNNALTAQTNGHANPSPKIHLQIIKSDEVNNVGTADPVNDFKILAGKGITLSELSQEMIDAVESLVYCNIDGTYSKASDAMKYFRTECVKGGPEFYNDWLKSFKSALNDRKKSDVLELICEKQLGFILKEENPESTYETENSHNDSQAYENDTVPNTVELTMQSEVNDMFNDM